MSLSDNKSPQVSRTLPPILAYLDNAAVWMVATHLLISKSSSPWINLLVTTERTNYNGCHRHFHVPKFIKFPSKVQVFISLFALLRSYAVVSQNAEIHYLANSLFCWLSLGLDQSGPGSNSNDGVLRIHQSSSFTGTSPLYCLVSYPGHSFGGWGVLPFCREAVSVFYSPADWAQLFKWMIWAKSLKCWLATWNHIIAYKKTSFPHLIT